MDKRIRLLLFSFFAALITLASAAFCTKAVYADEKVGANLSYTLTGSDAGGYTLTLTGSGAMYDYDKASDVPWYSKRTYIRSVSLPSGITKIGSYAFYEFTTVYGDLNIPTNVTSIGQYSFYKAAFSNDLLTIPAKVKTINDYAFYGNNGYRALSVGNGKVSIGDHAFEKCTALETVTVEGGTDIVGSYAFNGCTGMTTLILKSGVKSINSSAFMGCTALRSLAIESGLESIGADAFYGCKALSGSLEIPATVTTMGVEAFYNCGFDGDLIIRSGLTSIPRSAFYNCGFMGTVTLPSALQTIEDHAFYGVNKISSFVIPPLVNKVGSYAFGGTYLEEIYFEGNAPTDLGSYYGSTSRYPDTSFGDNSKVTLYRLSNRSGWSNPWNGYTTAVYSASDKITSVQLDSYSLTIKMDETDTLSAMVFPYPDARQTVTWESSDEGIVTVDNGTVTPVSLGKAVITARSTEDTDVYAVCEVIVTDKVNVTGVELSSGNAELTVGDTLQLLANVLPDNADNRNMIWSSDNSGIASVNDTGLVTAIAVGEAKITVTSEDGGKTADCHVTVKEKENNTTECTVTFDPNGGSVQESSRTVTVGEAYGELPVPVYSNFSFNGWFTERTSGSAVYADTIVMTASDHTLYAHWVDSSGEPVEPGDTDEIESYTVKFFVNGNYLLETRTVKQGETVIFPEAPKKDGFKFIGWFLLDGTKWEESMAITGNMALYAGFEPDSGDEGKGEDGEIPEDSVSNNKPGKRSSERRGTTTNIIIIYYHEIPFYGKSKVNASYFGDITVSCDNIEYKADKIKVNRKKHLIQVISLKGADKKTNKEVKKATKGSGGLPFKLNPYYVNNSDKVTVKQKKDGTIKSVKILINGKEYKAQKDEWFFDSSSNSILFSGNNLAGVYKK